MYVGRSKLGGTVRPYYGGSRPPRSATTMAAPPSRASHVEMTSTPTTLGTSEDGELATDPKRLVHEAALAAGWAVLELDGALQIDVRITSQRNQIVSVEFDRRDREGRSIVVFTSRCGPFGARNAAPLLRYNAKLAYGAFAVERTSEGQEIVSLRASFPAVGRAGDVVRIVAEIASRADKVEIRLIGVDQF